MNEFYLNHGCLLNQDLDNAYNSLLELVNVVHFLREADSQLLLSPNFWSINLVHGDSQLPLNEFVYSLSNRDEARVIVSTAMDNGPHYVEVETLVSSISTYPYLDKAHEHIHYLLQSCFQQKQENIISMKDERILFEEKYKITSPVEELDINNFVGLNRISDYFQKRMHFSNIFEVFNAIESEFPNIIVLDSAKKSARKHNFYQQFQDVYEAIRALDNVELTLILDGYSSEDRKHLFYETVGYEISEESTRTMQMRSCVREREFKILDKGIEVFEWHIKIGRNTRIHYYIDVPERKIYIGHCGKHLRTSKS